MGITMYSKNKSHDLPCSGFMRLRRDVSSLCPDEIAIHYQCMIDNMHQYSNEDWDNYDKHTEELYLKYRKKYGKILIFLYAPDTEARMTYGTAKQLLNIIGDYTNDRIYGYAGWGESAFRWKHFKELLENAYQTKKAWGWW